MGQGLKIDKDASSESKLVLRGGSQLRTRLFGGYFVAPSYLPVRAEVKLPFCEAETSEVELRVEDALGIGVRDRALQERYELAVGEIEQAVANGLDGAVRLNGITVS